MVSTISTYIIDARGLQSLYWEELRRINENKDRSKSVSRSGGQGEPKWTLKDLQEHFDKRKVDKSIELIEIKRQIGEFLKQIETH